MGDQKFYIPDPNKETIDRCGKINRSVYKIEWEEKISVEHVYNQKNSEFIIITALGLKIGQSIDCPICLSEIPFFERCSTGCLHIFHKKCIDRHLKNNNNCPICRGPISFGSVMCFSRLFFSDPDIQIDINENLSKPMERMLVAYNLLGYIMYDFSKLKEKDENEDENEK